MVLLLLITGVPVVIIEFKSFLNLKITFTLKKTVLLKNEKLE